MLRVAGLMPINDGQLQVNRVPHRVQGVDLNKVMEIFNRDASVMQATRSAAATTTRPHPNRPTAPRSLTGEQRRAGLASVLARDTKRGQNHHLIYF
jgi:hypothetical protein